MEYVKKNITAILIGFALGVMTINIINTIDDVIVKIVLINKK